MPSDADLRILETLLARELISAREAAGMLARIRERGAVDLQHSLLSLRPWSDAERTALSDVFRSAASTDSPPTVADAAPSTSAIPPPSRAFGAPTPEPGHRPVAFERYEIVQEIARGGMGVVYRAKDVRLGRTVALKVLVGGTAASAEAIERFQREARMVAGLSHPRIVAVHDVGENEGACWFTMDYIEGSTLARLIAAKSVSRREGVAMLREVGLALHHAHLNGVVHRDVKPGNILVDLAGHAFIADFGLAREVQSDSRLTASGRPVGTPVYMSPEQAGGEHAALDARTDVYSLGATLYELLAGRPPYEGDNMMEVLFKVLGSDPQRPSCHDPTVPRDLEVIALRAMERDRERRYPTAKAFADDLGRYLDGEAIEARPSGVFYRSWKKARRHPVAAALAGAAALLLVAWTGVALAQSARAARKAQALAEEAHAALAAGRPEDALALLGRARNFDPDNRAVPILEDGCRNDLRVRAERAREEARLADALERNARRSRAQPFAESAQKILELTDVLARHGEHARRRERLQEAAGLLDQALAQDPEFAEAWYARGRVERLLGDSAKALADLDQAIALRDTYSAPYIERIGVRADLYHQRSSPGMLVEQYDGPIRWNFRDLSQDAEAQALLAAAHADLARVLAIGVRPEEGHYVRGAMSVVDGHPDDAVAELTQAIALHPYYAEAYEKRAFARLMQNDADGADADITKALELWPAFAEGLCYRAVIRFARKDPAGALADFEAAAAIDPGLRQASDGRALLHAAAGEWEAALAEYSRAIATWNDGAAYVNRATAYFKLQRLPESRADLVRAIELDPGDARAWLMRGQVGMLQGDLDGAVADIEKACALDPKDPYDCEALGWAHEKRKDWAAARAAYDRALERAPDEAKAYFYRGHARHELGDLDGARADYDAGLQRAPDDRNGLLERAQLRLFTHDMQGGRQDLDRLLAKTPGDAEARALRGRIRGSMGDAAGALEDFSAAVQAAPADLSYRYYRGLAYVSEMRWAQAIPDLEATLPGLPAGPEADQGRARLEEARYFAAHPEHWTDLQSAFTQLGEACARAEAAYRKQDWAGGETEYRAGLEVVRGFLAGKDEVLRRTVERNRGIAEMLVQAWYNLACCTARRAEKAPEAERETLAGEAMKALREALRLGFDDLRHVREDPDLGALHGRSDYQALIGK